MKKVLVGFAMALAALTAHAEPTFDQMQDLIAQKQYAAAEQGLEVIIKNHPNSAKAFYSMAQAQAGLGHQDKAQFALDKAKGLDPTLKFATQSNVEALQQAITPQVKKIEKVESGFHWLAAFLTALALAIIGWIAYLFYKKEKPDDKPFTGHVPPEPMPEPPASPKAEKVVVKPAPMRTGTPDVDNDPYVAPVRSRARSYTPRYVPPTPAPAPVVEHHYHNTNNSGSDMMTGVLVGSMLSDRHEHTRVVEREVVREVPVYRERETYTPPARSSSWDDDSSSKSSSRSSSWDDDSSSRSSSSSSWSSSSSSSSSWDSGSSSSDSSSSSSSWD